MILEPSDSTQQGERGPAGLLLGAMVGSLVAARFETVVACIVAAIAAAIAAGSHWPSAGWVRALLIGLVLALVLNLFLTPGHPLPGPRLLGLRPTHEGLRQGTLLALRILGATAALLGLGAAWPKERAADELGRLARPLERLGAPVSEARVVTGLALRFAPLLGTEARRIAKTQDLRAGRAPGNMGEWLRRRRAALIPTLVGALERAERTALALEARHYRMRPMAAGNPLVSVWGMAGIVLAGTALVWRA